MHPIKTTRLAARRFARRAVLLDRPVADVAQAIAHLGYIQIDPINICGRMHDLVLRNRVKNYVEGSLMEHIHSTPRPGIEHYIPEDGVLVAFPLHAWPHLISRTRFRRETAGGYAGRLTKSEERVASHILTELTERGPLSSDDIEHEGRASTAWGTHGRIVKTVLEKMMVQGRVFIAKRRAFRRVYDLPERVLSSELLAATPPDQETTKRWFIHLRLRQRRLVALKKADIPLVEDLIQPVHIDDLPVVYCLKEDVPFFDSPASSEERGPLLLAPLDPLIYDRKLTYRLWGFDYTWEVYTPPAKRKRGYYALPVLVRTELAGHVDLKADRDAGKLRVISRKVRRGVKAAPAIGELARFLGLRR